MGDLEHDLEILKEIEKMWSGVNEDPKLKEFITKLREDKILSKSQILVFTESKETAQYLEEQLNPIFDQKVLAYSSESGAEDTQRIIDNFDPDSPNQKNDLRIVISTEVLSEGVNLHRSNVVVNYDIPWNPTRIVQRVGRINRVRKVGKDKEPPQLYTYNFLPAGPINKNIGLQEAAEAKIQAFIEMLGTDARFLIDEEIKSHDLFVRIMSKESLEDAKGGEDLELKYLSLLRELRDHNPDFFERIKNLAKKARTAKKKKRGGNSLITFFRKGKLRKVFRTDGTKAEELDFFAAAEALEAKEGPRDERIGKDYYELLKKNKTAFKEVFTKGELPEIGANSSENKLRRTIKTILNAKELTAIDQDFLQEVLKFLSKGAVPPRPIKTVLKKISTEIDPLKVLSAIRVGIPAEFFKETPAEGGADISGPREVILSEYLLGGD